MLGYLILNTRTRYWIRVLDTPLDIIAVGGLYKNRSPPHMVRVIGTNNRAEGKSAFKHARQRCMR